MQDDSTPQVVTGQRRLVFRVPATTLLAALFFAVCATPVAFGGLLPGLQVLELLPVAVIVWVLRVRTTADGDGLRIRTLLGHRELPWSQIAALRVAERGWVRAVIGEGDRAAEVALPAVRARHLPMVAMVSGGHLPDL